MLESREFAQLFMTTATRKLLMWEFKWIPVEMIAFGLLLLLGFHLDEAGSWFLFVALAISGVVRLMHYGVLGKTTSSTATRA